MATVLITGSSSGIGMATAVAFGRAGYRVHATMRDLGRGAELRETVEREGLPVPALGDRRGFGLPRCETGLPA